MDSRAESFINVMPSAEGCEPTRRYRSSSVGRLLGTGTQSSLASMGLTSRAGKAQFARCSHPHDCTINAPQVDARSPGGDRNRQAPLGETGGLPLLTSGVTPPATVRSPP